MDASLVAAIVTCVLTVGTTFALDIRKSTKDRSALQAEHATLRGDHTALKEDLRDGNSTLREDHFMLRQDNKALRAEFGKAEGRLTELHKEERQEIRRLADAAIRAENAQKQAEANGVNIQDMVYGIRALVDKVARLDAANKDFMAIIRDNGQQIADLKKQVEHGASVIQKQRQEIRRLESRLRGRQPGRDAPEWER